LPPGARVIKGKRLAQQIKLHSMIQKSICSLLIPLGADPGHTNINKTKSPLSPGWSVECCDDHFVTMNERRAFLPTITPNDLEMRRRAKVLKVAKDTGVEITLSDAIWHDGVSERTIAIRSAQATKDPTYLSAVRRSKRNNHVFVDWLYHADNGVVTKQLIGIHNDTRAVRAVLAAQRQFVVELDMTPSEVGNFRDRGRDALKNADLAPLPKDACKDMRKARRDLLQNLARQRTQENKLADHYGLIAEEIEARLQAGVPIVKSEVVNALVSAGTVGRSTAYARFDFAFETVQRSGRYQVSLSTGIQTQSSVASVEAAPVTASVPGQAVAGTPDPVNHADLPLLPAWVVCKDSLTEFEEACRLRDHWRVAVAAWRAARARKRPAAGVDLAEDPAFRSMVLDRSAWNGRRRH
jgi:precorrin-2 methylase